MVPSELLTESGSDVFKLNKSIASAHDITSIVGDGDFEQTSGERGSNATWSYIQYGFFYRVRFVIGGEGSFKWKSKSFSQEVLQTFYFINGDFATFFDGNSGRYMLTRVYTNNVRSSNLLTISGRVNFKLTDGSGTQTWCLYCKQHQNVHSYTNKRVIVYEYNLIIQLHQSSGSC